MLNWKKFGERHVKSGVKSFRWVWRENLDYKHCFSPVFSVMDGHQLNSANQSYKRCGRKTNIQLHGRLSGSIALDSSFSISSYNCANGTQSFFILLNCKVIYFYLCVCIQLYTACVYIYINAMEANLKAHKGYKELHQ